MVCALRLLEFLHLLIRLAERTLMPLARFFGRCHGENGVEMARGSLDLGGEGGEQRLAVDDPRQPVMRGPICGPSSTG